MTALLPTLLLTVFSGSHFCYKLQDILQESYLGTLEGSSFPQKRLFSEMIIHLSIRLSRSMFNIISYLLYSPLLIRALCLTRIINPIHVIDAINACFHISLWKSIQTQFYIIYCTSLSSRWYQLSDVCISLAQWKLTRSLGKRRSTNASRWSQNLISAPQRANK